MMHEMGIRTGTQILKRQAYIPMARTLIQSRTTDETEQGKKKELPQRTMEDWSTQPGRVG